MSCKFFPIILATALLTACGSPVTNPVTGKSERSAMSESAEVAEGKKGHAQVLEEYGVLPNAKVQAYVNDLGQRLAKQSHRGQLEWHFTVLDSPEINAFALPGGYVYVTRGIMAYMESEADLAGVIGHEIGHVTARHGAQRATRQQNAGLGVLAAAVLGAVLESKAPSLSLPVDLPPADQADVLGATGGLLLALLAVLACTLFLVDGLLAGGSRADSALSGVMSGHAAALGRAPGFVATSDPDTLERSLRLAGVSPADASVEDWSALRMRLKGGLSLGEGLAGAVAMYSVDGRPLSITTLPWLADPGQPQESWLVNGVRLIAYNRGDTGLVVSREAATGRVRIFASAMPAEQLLALLAYGLKLESSPGASATP